MYTWRLRLVVQIGVHMIVGKTTQSLHANSVKAFYESVD
jgi:hypothetical protein